MHSITATHTLNGHRNDEDDDDIGKEGQLWKKCDGLVWHAERHDVVCDWQGVKWMDGEQTAQLIVWW